MERFKKYYTNKKYWITAVLILLSGYTLLMCKSKLLPAKEQPVYKPVIYFYPEKETKIKAELLYKGEVFASYPDYNLAIKGWEITAYPKGKIINDADGKEYSYLFWEGNPSKPIAWNLSKGFVVKGSETRHFLQETLAKIGLTPIEYNEFIVYWYPILQNNPYNLIHFADEQYTSIAPLNITPKPDATLRVFMVYKPLNEEVKIEPQLFKPFVRKGFTVVEWGGGKVDNDTFSSIFN